MDDAEREFGVSRRTLFRLISSGDLAKYRRIGDRKTYVSRAQLRALLGFKKIEPGA